MNTADYLRSHRCHDVPHFVKRWHSLAKSARLKLETVYVSGGFPVLFVSSAMAQAPCLYISAGVHGDEPAPVTALIEWAEENLPLLRTLPVALFPLFNPAGLALNTRADHRNVDLNRRFHDAGHPHIKAWWKCIGDLTFSTGLCLHEDYDAQGIYCYELNRSRRLHLADAAVKASEALIPRDPRRNIDGRRAKLGIIRRKRIPDLPGLPEAIALYLHNTDRTLTFETPSEFSLSDRVAAHKAFIESVVRGL
jgi:hypothetical protein